MTWSLVVTEDDGTAVTTISSADTIGDNRPLELLRGQDTINDVGVLQIGVQAEHALNDSLVEDHLVHVKEGSTVLHSWIVRTPQVGVIDAGEEAREVAVYHCDHLLDVLREGCVEPPNAIGSEPAGQDVRWDWTHPDRDNSDFTTPDVLGTVTDAQTNYTVTPYGIGQDGGGFVYPGIAKVIGPAGYGWTDDAPAGRCYFYKDIDFGTGTTIVINAVGDNGFEIMLANQTIIPFTLGFGTSASWGKKVVSGVQRVAAVVENGGTLGAEGPCTIALEIVEVDPGDNPLSLVDSSSSSWGIMEFPAEPPGWTPGGIMLQCLADEAAATQPTLTDVVCSFDEVNDSNGDPWPNTWDIGTKATTGLEVFFCKELAETYIDIDAHFNFGTGHITLDAWVKGHRSGTLTLTEGTNLASFTLPTSPALATSFVSQWNNGGNLAWQENVVTPATGRRPKRRGLSQGASRSAEQTSREAAAQLALFGRQRTTPTFTFARSDATSAGDLPPNWSKWSTATVTTSSRWLSDGDYDLIAVTFELNSNGFIDYTPEAGDKVIPAEVRAGMALRKMTAPNVGGQSRIVTPMSVQQGSVSVNRVGSAGS